MEKGIKVKDKGFILEGGGKEANNHKACDWCGIGRAKDMEGFTEELTHELCLCLKTVYWAEEGEEHSRLKSKFLNTT